MAVIKEEHQGINELRRMHNLEAINIWTQLCAN